MSALRLPQENWKFFKISMYYSFCIRLKEASFWRVFERLETFKYIIIWVKAELQHKKIRTTPEDFVEMIINYDNLVIFICMLLRKFLYFGTCGKLVG